MIQTILLLLAGLVCGGERYVLTARVDLARSELTREQIAAATRVAADYWAQYGILWEFHERRTVEDRPVVYFAGAGGIWYPSGLVRSAAYDSAWSAGMVLAHELGHELSLDNGDGGIMSNSQSGGALPEAKIAQARAAAKNLAELVLEDDPLHTVTVGDQKAFEAVAKSAVPKLTTWHHYAPDSEYAKRHADRLPAVPCMALMDPAGNVLWTETGAKALLPDGLLDCLRRRRGGGCGTTPTPTTTQPPPAPQPAAAEHAAKIAELEKRLAALERQQPIAGPQGPKGDKGDKGDAGMAATPEEVGKIMIAWMEQNRKFFTEPISRAAADWLERNKEQLRGKPWTITIEAYWKDSGKPVFEPIKDISRGTSATGNRTVRIPFERITVK
jgi:hypothetical protein